MNVFAEALRKSLADRGWSQGELSRRMGKKPSQQTIGRWLANDNLPQRNTVNLVADALEEDRVKWRDLWNESDTKGVVTPQPPQRSQQEEIAWLRNAVEKILLHLDIPGEDTPPGGPAPRRRRRA